MSVTLSGCFTLMLWKSPNSEVEFEDGAIGLVATDNPVEVEPRTWSDIGWLLLLTPYSLALDVITFPIQAFFADPFEFTQSAAERTQSAAEKAWRPARR